MHNVPFFKIDLSSEIIIDDDNVVVVAGVATDVIAITVGNAVNKVEGADDVIVVFNVDAVKNGTCCC